MIACLCFSDFVRKYFSLDVFFVVNGGTTVRKAVGSRVGGQH